MIEKMDPSRILLAAGMPLDTRSAAGVVESGGLLRQGWSAIALRWLRLRCFRYKLSAVSSEMKGSQQAPFRRTRPGDPAIGVKINLTLVACKS